MATEDCYRCGKPLDGYLSQLCPECRAKLEAECDEESEVNDEQ